MTAIGQVEFPDFHILLRSFLSWNRRLHVPDSNRRQRPRHELMILRLVSHLAMTSLLFVTLITFVWVVSWTFHLLHSVYPFSDDIFKLLAKLEIFFVYADAVMSGIVLLNGVWHYILDVIRGTS